MSTPRRWLIGVLRRLLPVKRRELGEALVAEVSAVPAGDERRGWLAGGLWFLVKEASAGIVGYGIALCLAAATLVWVDRAGSSDDAGHVTLLLLLVSAGLLGFASPRWTWVASLILGSTISIANMLYLTLGPARAQPIEPAGLGGAASLLVLLIPSLIAGYVGAGARRLAQRSQ